MRDLFEEWYSNQFNTPLDIVKCDRTGAGYLNVFTQKMYEYWLEKPSIPEIYETIQSLEEEIKNLKDLWFSDADPMETMYSSEYQERYK